MGKSDVGWQASMCIYVLARYSWHECSCMWEHMEALTKSGKSTQITLFMHLLQETII